jgi:broad specificity phosphatase PhoE
VERAILARHGESVFSALGLLNGDVTVAGGLTPAGLEQARFLGDRLRREPVDIVVTSAFERTIVTADEALGDRVLPRVVLPDLNDPLYGQFEGAEIEEYRAWTLASPSSQAPGEGGESRYAIVERYAGALRKLVERSEDTVLVVAHSLPIAYALTAREGREPAARMPLVEYATPYVFTRGELEEVAAVLERWLSAPTF